MSEMNSRTLFQASASPVFKVYNSGAPDGTLLLDALLFRNVCTTIGDVEQDNIELPASVLPTAKKMPASPASPRSKDSKPLYSSRIVLTTYPGSASVNPLPMNWGAKDPQTRGPIVASRQPQSLPLRNAIGAFGGAYSIYRSLAIAMGELDPHHKPNLINTEPVIEIGPFPSW